MSYQEVLWQEILEVQAKYIIFVFATSMDLICSDIIIDKMAVLVGGLHHALIRSNQNELLRTFLQLSQHGTM